MNMKITVNLLLVTLFSTAMLIGCQSKQLQDSSEAESVDRSGEPSLEKTQEEPKKRSNLEKGCIGGNCENGTGTYVYDTGDRYTGPFEKGMRQGTGVMDYANGDRYEGEYRSDIREGNGTYTFRNKDVYAGRFKNGIREGKGAYTFASTGEVFEGEFQNDGNTADGYIKRDGEYYLCQIRESRLFCSSTPIKDPGKLPQ